MFIRFKKFSLGFIALAILGTSAAGVLTPQVAHAQGVVGIGFSIPETIKDVAKLVWEGIQTASLNAAVRMTAYAVRKMAYDSAVWLASGGKGQTPFAHTDSFGDYLTKVGDEAAGSFLEEWSNSFGQHMTGNDKYTVDICHIPDVKLDLAFKVGLRTNLFDNFASAEGPQARPKCTLSQFKDEWINPDASLGDLLPGGKDVLSKKFYSKYGANQVGERFNLTLRTDDSDLGIYHQVTGKINERILVSKDAAEKDREETGETKKKTTTGDRTLIPATLIEEQLKSLTPDKQQKEDKDQLEALIATGNIKVIPAAMSIFLNTLVGTMVKNYQEKGILPFEGLWETKYGVSGGVASEYYAISGGGAARAQSFFSHLKSIKITEKQNYDILSELANCPEIPGVYNCRIDDEMVTALRQGETGVPATIREALDPANGWLHGSWKLIPPSDSLEDDGRNNDKNCFQKAYCFGNIQTLRQLRILPLGFEIAALKSPPDAPWTLDQVVKGFEKCPADPGEFDPANPFCHLIDPNWVLKSPPTKCNAYVYSSSLLSNGVPDRMQECVDLQTCVGYDELGNCKEYGYCTREKNTWRFAAQECKAQYSTCRSFTNSSGQSVSYLYRTLDSQYCTKENAGCRAYSFTKDASGNWLAPGIQNNNTNNGAYFNSKLSTNCSPNSAGCSAFNVVGGTRQLHLKRAPDFLQCYDANPTTAAVDYPKTQSDLVRITGAPECSNYAGVCVPDEVNCNFYAPQLGGGGKVPGRFTPAVVLEDTTNGVVTRAVKWNDQCDAKCVGYAAYRELPSNYSNGESVAYIIPSSGQRCTAVEEGCSAFTNLNATQSGLEQVENFSYLRPCARPGITIKSKNYVTYEGSVQGGFQLKTFHLVENETTDRNGPVGAPKYYYKTEEDLDRQRDSCTEQKYKDGSADPDCRQFNDEAGNIFYRLLSYTIPVVDSCTPYRLNSTEMYELPIGTVTNLDACTVRKGLWQNDLCKVCFQNGEYRNGSCFYDGLPDGVSNTAGDSRGCTAQAETCRAYKGNTGNNIDVIFNDTFEGLTSTAAVVGWTGGTLSAESTRVGEHSLEYSGSQGASRNVKVEPGGSYDLTFWAKGTTGGQVAVKFGAKGGTLVDVGASPLRETWNFYHIGPFDYTGNSVDGELLISRTGDRLFIDNIRLVKVRDLQYLVKKTLSVDPLCDSNLNDNLPGEALGCQAYKDPAGKNYYLTGFSYLCRENAIGCTAVTDTRNTPKETGPRAYNVFLAGEGTITVTIDGSPYKCTVEVGKPGCYVNMVGHDSGRIKELVPGGFVPSTVYIPSDSIVGDPLYLVSNKTGSCNEIDLGCTIAGAQKITPAGVQFVTTTVKADPATYDKTLCQVEAAGCNAYGDINFKDPGLTGQKTCAYRTGVRMPNGVDRDGWFWKGVGKCDLGVNAGTFCSANADCGDGSTCQKIGDQPCYTDYLVNGEYGVWSSGNIGKYQNFVGECPQDQDKCTEFVDHNDNDHARYFIKDSSISEGDCQGQVSQKFGCAVFDQTDNPNKFFNTRALYNQSESQNGNKVTPPSTADPKNDANIIIKVARDRECGEWLSCNTRPVFDQDTGKYRDQCFNVRLCNGERCGIKSSYTGEVLTERTYRSRELGWSKMDFSGHSIFGLYPLEELVDHNFVTSTEVDTADWRLVKEVSCGGNNCKAGDISQKGYACESPGDSCGRVGSDGKFGLCVRGTCVRTIKGEGVEGTTAKVRVEEIDYLSRKLVCRGYPEANAPFPFTDYIKKKQEIYGLANKCNEKMSPSGTVVDYACDCDYTKVSYGDSITKYWAYDESKTNTHDKTELAFGTIKQCSGGTRIGQVCETGAECPGEGGGACNQSNIPNKKEGRCSDNPATVCNGSYECNEGATCKLAGIPDGLCLGGPNGIKGAEKSCTKNADCPDGTCQQQNNLVQFRGQKGYCIEEDTRSIKYGIQTDRNCLTWFPGRTNGTADLFNQFVEAGFDVGKLGYKAGPYYCESKEKWQRQIGEVKQLTLSFDCDGDDSVHFVTANGAPNIENSEWTVRVPLKDAIQNLKDKAFSSECNVSDNKASGCGNGGIQSIKEVDVTTAVSSACNLTSLGAATLGNTVNLNVADDARCDVYNGNVVTIQYECNYSDSQNPNPWVVGGKQGWDYPNNELYDSEERCKVLYKIADKPSDVKAFTQNIWKSTDPNLQNQLQKCQPYGATAVNQLFAGPIAIVFKANPPECVLGPFREASSVTAEAYLTNKVHQVETLRKIYAKAATRYEIQGVSQGSKVCQLPPDKQIGDSSGSMNMRDLFDAQVGTPCSSFYSCSSYFAGVVSNYCPQGSVNETECDRVCGFNLGQDLETYRSTGVGWDITNAATAIPPKVHTVRGCKSVDGIDVCIEGAQGITLFVNDQFASGGTIKLGERNEVNMRFFAFANTNQMAVRGLAIDWGEKDKKPGEGDNYLSFDPSYYRNQRGALDGACKIVDGKGKCEITDIFHDGGTVKYSTQQECKTDNNCNFTQICEEESESSKIWGIVKGKTCNTGYHEFKGHVYQCEKDTSPGSNFLATCNDSRIGNLAGEYPQGCCVYQPRVHVRDNWGWCTGTCTNTAGGKGCYSGTDAFGGELKNCDIEDESDPTAKLKAWVPFGGYLVVPPPFIDEN